MVKLNFSNEKEWHALRSSHVGGSEVAALFNVQPDYMPGEYALWQYKTGFASPPTLNNNSVKWGSRLEKPIAEGIAEDNKWGVRKGGYYQDDICPTLGASLDYEIIDSHEYKGNGCFEIKNVNTFNFSKTWNNDEPPIHILLQLQHQLAATGYQWGIIAALRGGFEPYIYYYQRDERIISKIRSKVNSFWEKVTQLKEPSLDHSAVNRKILNDLFPVNEDDEILDLTYDQELEQLCSQFKELSNKRKELQKKEDTLKFSIIRKMTNHKKAITSSFRISSSLSQKTDDREAVPGEIIKGRAGSRRLTVTEIEV